MLIVMLMLSCPSGSKGTGETGSTTDPNPCEGVEGADNTRHTEFRYGDVTLAACRDVVFGGPPVLVPFGAEGGSGSVIVGTRTWWHEAEEDWARAVVQQIELHPEGENVRVLENEPGIWVEVEGLAEWAAARGDVVDLNGDRRGDVIFSDGTNEAALSAFMDFPSASPEVISLPFEVWDLGDVTGDSIADLARLIEVQLDPKDPEDVVTLLSIQALPVEGSLDEQPWEINLGDSFYTGMDAIARQPVDGLVRGGFDHNGDGIGDVVTGEEITVYGGPGTVRVFTGPIVETRVGDDADATLRRQTSTCEASLYPAYCDSVGGYLRSAGDLDGDGYEELLIGSSDTWHDGLTESGGIWIVPGPLEGTMDIDFSASAMIYSTEEWARLPGDIFTGGDLNDDGRLDLIVSRNNSSDDPEQMGVRLLLGPFEGARDWTDGPQIYNINWPYINSVAMNEDLDGDGIHDLVMTEYDPASLHIWFSTVSMEWPRTHTLTD